MARVDTWMPGRWREFDPLAHVDLPLNMPAVYAIYIDGELVYIGQTANLRGRFQTHHLRPGYARNIITPWGDLPGSAKITAKAKPSRRYGDWAMIELRLIRRLRPRLNCTFVNSRHAKRVA